MIDHTKVEVINKLRVAGIQFTRVISHENGQYTIVIGPPVALPVSHIEFHNWCCDVIKALRRCDVIEQHNTMKEWKLRLWVDV